MAADIGVTGSVPYLDICPEWVPQSMLMPHVGLLVHHGGAGRHWRPARAAGARLAEEIAAMPAPTR